MPSRETVITTITIDSDGEDVILSETIEVAAAAAAGKGLKKQTQNQKQVLTQQESETESVSVTTPLTVNQIQKRTKKKTSATTTKVAASKVTKKTNVKAKTKASKKSKLSSKPKAKPKPSSSAKAIASTSNINVVAKSDEETSPQKSPSSSKAAASKSKSKAAKAKASSTTAATPSPATAKVKGKAKTPPTKKTLPTNQRTLGSFFSKKRPAPASTKANSNSKPKEKATDKTESSAVTSTTTTASRTTKEITKSTGTTSATLQTESSQTTSKCQVKVSKKKVSGSESKCASKELTDESAKTKPKARPKPKAKSKTKKGFKRRVLCEKTKKRKATSTSPSAGASEMASISTPPATSITATATESAITTTKKQKQNSPTSKSSKLPNLLNDDIKSIVLGAHGDTPMPSITPPPLSVDKNGHSSICTSDSKFRGIHVRALLPQMVLTDEADADVDMNANSDANVDVVMGDVIDTDIVKAVVQPVMKVRSKKKKKVHSSSEYKFGTHTSVLEKLPKNDDTEAEAATTARPLTTQEKNGDGNEYGERLSDTINLSNDLDSAPIISQSQSKSEEDKNIIIGVSLNKDENADTHPDTTIQSQIVQDVSGDNDGDEDDDDEDTVMMMPEDHVYPLLESDLTDNNATEPIDKPTSTEAKTSEDHNVDHNSKPGMTEVKQIDEKAKPCDEVIILDSDESTSSEKKADSSKPKTISSSISSSTATTLLQPRKKQKPKKRAMFITSTKSNDTSASSAQKGSNNSTTTVAQPDEKVKVVSAPAPTIKKKSAGPSKSTSKLTTKKLQSQVVAQLDKEDIANVAKFDAMKKKYMIRAKELVHRALSNSIQEEYFQKEAYEGKLDIPLTVQKEETQVSVDFRNAWVEKLAVLVQGSPLNIDDLAHVAQTQIMKIISVEGLFISIEAVASKIKLVATRSQNLVPIPEEKTKVSTAADIFADTNKELMWRWDLISQDLLPIEHRALVKKSRGIRRKLKLHQKAVVKLIQATEDGIECINSGSTKAKKQKLIAKISSEEEKVLKYEREEEKARLLNSSKKQKDLEKQHQAEERRKEKQRAEEVRKAEKAKKEEARKIEKAQKLEEKERKRMKETAKKLEKTEKQKSMMRSFFASPPAKAKSKSVDQSKPACNLHEKAHDSTKFWSMLALNEGDEKPFTKLSSRAVRSKKRRVRNTTVSVFAPTVSDNPFNQQVYYEERSISVRNRYKFLSFRENQRPPYHGTWSKKSTKVRGRCPFGKDTTYLDYDVDSEAEWEEGDDEEGEDCSETGKDDEELADEEGDIMKYNYQDGWLAEDDDLDMEDEDDQETKDLRKKKGEGMDCPISKFTAACVIAPLKGGIPLLASNDCPSLISDCVEGIDVPSAKELMANHYGDILIPGAICMDIFPPSLRKADSSNSRPKQSAQTMSRDDEVTFAKFVHNSTLKSKEMMVEELRNTYKDITSSRAQAMRKLDSIANKRRIRNGGGVIWEVKNEILKSLGLDDLVKEASVEIVAPSSKSSTKASEAGNQEVPVKKDAKVTLKKSKTKNTASTKTAATKKSPAPPPLVSPSKQVDLTASSSKKRKLPASASLLSIWGKKKKKSS
eukprot:CAMPEP_0194077568 /NCGR_PEP_ID=MMETSP0149-20130528/4172_1 /TAXON_ID=122233 /ORGANISM="Chaetoceros debilis, Strain MM31A-1" /LENGTH=1581 /DNA_ID=CAMNT_0038758635 /DNA_START=124 /DNA_END=4869 /DNA_ORIENTATION=+